MTGFRLILSAHLAWLALLVGVAYPVAAQESKPIYFGTPTRSVAWFPLYVAIKRGFLHKEGINLQPVVMDSRVIVPSMASKEIAYSTGLGSAMIGASKGLPLKVVMILGGKTHLVLVTRPEIASLKEIKGKTIGVTRPGDFTYKLAKDFLKKHNLSDKDVTLAPVGGTPTERYAALVQDVFQAILIQPPLDARGKKDGFNVIYHLSDLGAPFIYSSLFSNLKTHRERPALVQKMVAALAESVYLVEKKPELGMASVGKTLRISDAEVLQSAYDAFAKRLINRRLIVPAKMVADTIENAREEGTVIRRKANEVFDNTFAENLEKSGFLKELWGGALPDERKR